MRRDLLAALTGETGKRYPSACFRRAPIVDDDGRALPFTARDRDLGWRERGAPVRTTLIRRFLRSNLGRPFDDVRSDYVRAVADSPMRDDLVDCLLRRVENPRGVTHGGRPSLLRGIGLRWREPFYVDGDGILRENGRVRRGSSSTREALRHLTDPDLVPLVRAHAPVEERAELVRLAGVWYEVRHRRVPGGVGPGVTLHVDGFPVRCDELPVMKRQLASAEIRRLRLAAWAEDAALLAASVDGRGRDRAAQARQERLRADAARALGATGGLRLSRW